MLLCSLLYTCFPRSQAVFFLSSELFLSAHTVHHDACIPGQSISALLPNFLQIDSLDLFCTSDTVLILFLDNSAFPGNFSRLRSVSFNSFSCMLESLAPYTFLSLIKQPFISLKVHVDARACDCQAGIHFPFCFLALDKNTFTFFLGSQYIKYFRQLVQCFRYYYYQRLIQFSFLAEVTIKFLSQFPHLYLPQSMLYSVHICTAMLE